MLHGESLQESLGSQAELDKAMIGTELAAHGGAVALRGAVQMLYPGAVLDLVHRGHPEVISLGAEHAQRLFEGQRDLEP